MLPSTLLAPIRPITAELATPTEHVKLAMLWEPATTQTSPMEGITSLQVLVFVSHPATGTFTIVQTVVCNVLLLVTDARVRAPFVRVASMAPLMALDPFTTSTAHAPPHVRMDTSKILAMFAQPALRPV